VQLESRWLSPDDLVDQKLALNHESAFIKPVQTVAAMLRRAQRRRVSRLLIDALLSITKEELAQG
jgi:hypothetical protein